MGDTFDTEALDQFFLTRPGEIRYTRVHDAPVVRVTLYQHAVDVTAPTLERAMQAVLVALGGEGADEDVPLLSLDWRGWGP